MRVVASEQHRLHHPAELHLFAGELSPPQEVPARAEVILSHLRDRPGHGECEPTPVDDRLLQAVHDRGYLGFLESAHRRWCQRTGCADGEAIPFVRPYLEQRFTDSDDVLAELGRYSHDADPILAGTWEAAVASASCAVTAVEMAMAGAPAAYALCRPPGHHAASSSFGGYCYLNNVAIAAERVAAGGRRVAVLDVDAHAGNGTQAIFWQRPDVLCVSVHADPAHEYPYFAGHAGEVGAGEGEGFNLNLPLRPGSDWSAYEEALVVACQRVVAHGAEVVVVALGVDTASEDGVMSLWGDDFRRLGERLGSIGPPLVLVQEGGYRLDVLGVNVAAVMDGIEAVL